ncbi:ABC transporter permease [Hoeflea sp. TYP-13]|uniref:ABC transporter permease n=1 Tax=Hoeflea sp. TYP-13 TaxID=3230023 RepID=UPI0034C5F1A2
MRTWANIFWLGTKELRSVFSDYILIALIVWSFSFAIYEQSSSMGETVNNASIAFVDEDRSALSRALMNAFYPPYFKHPERIEAPEVDHAMDQSRFMFVVVIPPAFEADVRSGRQPSIQINIDATAVEQASLGAGYIQNIVLGEVSRFVGGADQATAMPVNLVVRRAFNPNGTQRWFQAIVSLLDNLSMLTIVLTGAALIREREHGTIEHLLVMPLTSFQIAMAKVWANGLIVLAAFTLSMLFIVEGLLDVPIAGSRLLLLSGTIVYLFAAAAIGIFLGTIARTMGQFALLMMMTIIPMMMLSGGMTPIESQPDVVQLFTWLLPSRHYMAFAQAVVFRGAGMDIVWPEFLKVAGLGSVFFIASLILFRHSITVAK